MLIKLQLPFTNVNNVLSFFLSLLLYLYPLFTRCGIFTRYNSKRIYLKVWVLALLSFTPLNNFRTFIPSKRAQIRSLCWYKFYYFFFWSRLTFFQGIFIICYYIKLFETKEIFRETSCLYYYCNKLTLLLLDY